MTNSIFQHRVVAVDLEGDGNNPPEPVELSIVELTPGGPGRVHAWLIDPGGPITEFATRIHGIRNSDLLGAPGFEDIEDRVREMIDDAVVVGHNVGVDMKVLRRKLPDLKPRRVLDTMRLAKSVAPGQPSYGLQKLAQSLGVTAGSDITARGAHSASYDALLTAEMFLKLLEKAGARADDRLALAEVVAEEDRAPRLL